MAECDKCSKRKKDTSFLRTLIIMKRLHILVASLHNMPLNVSHTDFHTMSHIMQSAELNPSGVSIGNLARDFQISPPAVSRAISSLEKRGYVKRLIDVNNRRSVTVIPTEKGIAAMNEDRMFFERVEKNISKKIGNEKLNELEQLLNQLYKAVYDTIEEEKKSL